MSGDPPDGARLALPIGAMVALAGCMAGCMAGCTVGPDYLRPSINTPAHYAGAGALPKGALYEWIDSVL